MSQRCRSRIPLLCPRSAGVAWLYWDWLLVQGSWHSYMWSPDGAQFGFIPTCMAWMDQIRPSLVSWQHTSLQRTQLLEQGYHFLHPWFTSTWALPDLLSSGKYCDKLIVIPWIAFYSSVKFTCVHYTKFVFFYIFSYHGFIFWLYKSVKTMVD